MILIGFSLVVILFLLVAVLKPKDKPLPRPFKDPRSDIYKIPPRTP